MSGQKFNDTAQRWMAFKSTATSTPSPLPPPIQESAMIIFTFWGDWERERGGVTKGNILHCMDEGDSTAVRGNFFRKKNEYIKAKQCVPSTGL